MSDCTVQGCRSFESTSAVAKLEKTGTRRHHFHSLWRAPRALVGCLERLGRYEVHLDRKLERTLAMLLRVKDLRQGAIAG